MPKQTITGESTTARVMTDQYDETEGIDLAEEIEAKFEKNREREFKHGKESE